MQIEKDCIFVKSTLQGDELIVTNESVIDSTILSAKAQSLHKGQSFFCLENLIFLAVDSYRTLTIT